MRIKLGGSAVASTGERCAVVDRVIVEPERWTATHLVLAKGDRLPSDKLVSVDLVERWTEDSVVLRLTTEDIQHLPDFIAREYATPRHLLPSPTKSTGQNVPARELFTHEGVPYGPGILPHESKPVEGEAVEAEPLISGRIQLRQGETVEVIDGELGCLDLLLLDPYTNRINSLVVDSAGRHLSIPVEWVGYIDPDRIRLAASEKQARHLVGPPSGHYLSEFPDKEDRETETRP